jgi:homoserine O-acetyltransferase/O-succinyltransferase
MKTIRLIGLLILSIQFMPQFTQNAMALKWSYAHHNFATKKEDSYKIKDFKFHTGEVFPELKIAYTTIGDPHNPAVLVLHGTTGSGIGMLENRAFSEDLFFPGQPLDAAKYFIILPDAIGTGQSSKPSDGLRAKFPRYNYDDMVDAQYRLVKEHFKIDRLRLVIGNSMGGMQTWMWAAKYPIMDIAVPMASLPTEMSSRNWMLRRLITESIRRDPLWQGGDYKEQPPSALFASTFYAIATNGGTQATYKAAPTRERADRILDSRLAAKYTGDANDHLYQWESSGDYNPSSGLEKITATLLAINSADDERNPPELGVLEREIKRVKNGSFYLIPASENTAGHGTTGQAKFWKAELVRVLAAAPAGR